MCIWAHMYVPVFVSVVMRHSVCVWSSDENQAG